jgi:TolB-like protein
MQKTFIIPILLLVLNFAFAQTSKPQDEAVFSGLPDGQETDYEFHKKPNIAVFPFTDANTAARETGFGRTVSAMLVTAFRNSFNFTVIEYSELLSVFPNKTLDISGLTKEETKKIKNQLKVDVILIGDVSFIENTLYIDARLFDVNNAKIVYALSGSCTDLKTIRNEADFMVMKLEQNYLRQWLGSLSITSELPNAEVYLNEKFIGVTSSKQPLVVNDVLEGIYQVKLIRGGYYDWQGQITVMAKMERSVEVELIAKPGSMNIYSEPSGAKIYLDNAYVGETPMSLEKVAEGEHEIRLIKLNYKIWTSKVVVRSFKPTDVKTTLEVSPGILTVNSDPVGADIFVKGKFIAKTPYTLGNITPGEVVVRVEKEGFYEWTTSALIEPNDHKVLDIVLKEKVGNINVNSMPEGAAVYLVKSNGEEKLIGQTPVLNYTTSIGNYNVRVEKEDYFNKVKSITVNVGETSDISYLLEKKPGSIVVKTTPENARIFLDGIYKGRSPMRLTNLKEGDYVVTMTMPYASETVKVTVKSNRDSKIESSINKPVNYVYAITITGLVTLLFNSLAR